MAEQPIRPEAAGVTDSGLFIRNATGLVRGMSQRASIILNFIPGHPTQTLAAVLFAYLVQSSRARIRISHCSSCSR